MKKSYPVLAHINKSHTDQTKSVSCLWENENGLRCCLQGVQHINALMQANRLLAFCLHGALASISNKSF